MKDTPALLQTIAVLSVCLVYLARQVIETYKAHERKKNGNGRARDNSALLLELHEMENTKELRVELKRNRESMDELRAAIGKMNDSLVKLAAEIRSQHAALQRVSVAPHHKGSKQVG